MVMYWCTLYNATSLSSSLTLWCLPFSLPTHPPHTHTISTNCSLQHKKTSVRVKINEWSEVNTLLQFNRVSLILHVPVAVCWFWSLYIYMHTRTCICNTGSTEGCGTAECEVSNHTVWIWGIRLPFPTLLLQIIFCSAVVRKCWYYHQVSAILI